VAVAVDRGELLPTALLHYREVIFIELDMNKKMAVQRRNRHTTMNVSLCFLVVDYQPCSINKIAYKSN
jgi:hypothetical protein